MFNYQTVGLDSWVQSALKSILRVVPIFESAARFFVIILKLILTSIFEIKIHEKKSLAPKNFIFEGRVPSNSLDYSWPRQPGS